MILAFISPVAPTIPWWIHIKHTHSNVAEQVVWIWKFKPSNKSLGSIHPVASKLGNQVWAEILQICGENFWQFYHWLLDYTYRKSVSLQKHTFSDGCPCRKFYFGSNAWKTCKRLHEHLPAHPREWRCQLGFGKKKVPCVVFIASQFFPHWKGRRKVRSWFAFSK